MELSQPFGFSLKTAKDLIGKYDKNGDKVLDKEEYEDLKKEILNNERQRLTNHININTKKYTHEYTYYRSIVKFSQDASVPAAACPPRGGLEGAWRRLQGAWGRPAGGAWMESTGNG